MLSHSFSLLHFEENEEMELNIQERKKEIETFLLRLISCAVHQATYLPMQTGAWGINK